MSKLPGIVIALLLAVVAAGAYLWWRQPPELPPIEQAVDAPPLADAPIEAPPPGPETRYPIELVPPTTDTAITDPGNDFGAAMAQLIGRDAVAKFLQMADFPRRVVATVDNLARAHAAPVLWPVHPTAGRFTVEGVGDDQSIASASNPPRYQPLVSVIQGVSTDKAVALYVRMYPQFQSAYEELGYPRGYFNDRLIAVIDSLLSTPEPDQPPRLQLTEVKGDVKSQRPWVRYQYVDANLEALPSGQKMLLRMSPAQRKAVKAKLGDFRRRLTGEASNLSLSPGSAR
jgi:hypothetical protein